MPRADGATTGNRDDGQSRRRSDKLSSDPAVRRAILSAALEITREKGVRGVGVADVLERCELGTRAFYRNFASKDELLTALFLDVACTETRRLRRKMKATSDAVGGVSAWIDGRLDLAFDQDVKSDLRRLSEEAQSLMFSSPPLIEAAFGELLTPLVEQLDRGLREGVFIDIDPLADAQIIQGAVWACTSRQWTTGDFVRHDVRKRVVRACLRALGVAPETVAVVLAEQRGDDSGPGFG